GPRWLYGEGEPDRLFTENDTNTRRLFDAPSPPPYVKDAINDYVVDGRKDAVNPTQTGTKAALHYRIVIDPGGSFRVGLRLTSIPLTRPFGQDFEAIVAQRVREADEFYATVIPAQRSEDARRVMRQAFAGLLWNNQFYHYDVRTWLAGDPTGPPPPLPRAQGRNSEWRHLYNADVISMPDKWEYPWYAAWDLAFHCIPL